jgi:hypothetical protein
MNTGWPSDVKRFVICFTLKLTARRAGLQVIELTGD